MKTYDEIEVVPASELDSLREQIRAEVERLRAASKLPGGYRRIADRLEALLPTQQDSPSNQGEGS